MGGRQYAVGKGRRVGGKYYPPFSEVERLLEDYGCLHFKFSIVLGVSSPAYSENQLAKRKAEDKKTVDFEGKSYTKYEATQVQRQLETAMRKQKDLANMAKAAGDDGLRREAQEKINLLTSKYAKFSKATGLPTKMERARVAGFRSVKVKGLPKVAKASSIDKMHENDIINTRPGKGNNKKVTAQPNHDEKNIKQGSILWSSDKRSRMRQSKKILNGNKYETAIVYDASGDIVLRKRAIVVLCLSQKKKCRK